MTSVTLRLSVPDSLVCRAFVDPLCCCCRVLLVSRGRQSLGATDVFFFQT